MTIYMQKSKKEFLKLASAIMLIFAGLGVYSLLTGKFQLCIFRIFTGLPCPGCGLTRAFILLLQGKFLSSLHFHLLLIPVLFTLFTAVTAFIVKFFQKENTVRKGVFTFFLKLDSSKYFYGTMFILLFLYYIYRMITFFPAGPEPMTYDPASILAVLYSKLLAVFSIT